MPADAPESGVGLARAAPCPQCGYDMRGLGSEVCPECGLDSADWEQRRFRIPWERGWGEQTRRGVFRAMGDYITTTWLALSRPDQFCTAAYGRLSWPAARSYRRWAILSGVVALWVGIGLLEWLAYYTVRVRMLSVEVLAIAPTLAAPLGLWLLTVIPPEFFRARSDNGRVLVRMNSRGERDEERAAALAHYASAALHLLWLAPLFVIGLPSYFDLEDSLAFAPWVFGGVLLVTIAVYGLRLHSIARRALHRGYWRAMSGFIVAVALSLLMWVTIGPLVNLGQLVYYSLTTP